MQHTSRRLLVLAVVAPLAAWLLAAPAPARAAAWCGSPAPADRAPDAAQGSQFHLIYAVPADGADRSAEWAARMVDDQEAINAWWLTQDPARAPRHDLHAFGCDSYWGQLDVSAVRLPQLGLFYDDGQLIGDKLRDDLRALGFDHARKKYVVYYDGAVAVRGFCAQATGTSFGWGIAIVYVQTDRCPLADDRFRRHVVAHEMVHTLDVPTSSLRIPHLCPDRDHFCDSEYDLMSGLPGRKIGLDAGVVLDHGRDDYYGHSDSWWDAQDSPFLRPTQAARVSVTISAGAGAVRSSEGTLDCPSTCSGEIELGRRVILTAAPAAGFRFAGWGGRCGGLAEGCVTRVDGDFEVTAAFVPVQRLLRIAVAGGGRIVASTGRSCADRCAVPAPNGATVVLSARPRKGHRFAGWGGACKGRRPACRLEVSGDRSVRATFVRVRAR